MPSVHVIIVAAGSGLRFGTPLPKQFCDLEGRAVVMHTIDAFRHLLPDAKLTLVISATMRELWQRLCAESGYESPHIAYGGATRWESVRNALSETSAYASDIIMVHDAARPVISSKMIGRILAGFDEEGKIDGVIPAVAVTDSLRLVGADGRSESIDRNRLRAVQTPQAFIGYKLRKAYELPYRDTFTDDASVMEAAGYDNLLLVDGCTSNIKITNPGDMELASIHLKNPSRE